MTTIEHGPETREIEHGPETGTRGKTDPGHDGSRGTGAAVVTRRRLGASTGAPMPSGATTTVPEGPIS
ncbi:hypothetical protein [Streptomyces sp. Ru87]|uniref:hypothetical protein n=1 Tax=Streptomyces sp. Ru87 TaxID=2044307 RepID=UPI00117C09EA|nr:hypothetical protein [Streptomyces sp. Ru87]